MKLRSILSQQPIQMLRHTADQVGLPSTPNKTILIDLLCQALTDPKGIQDRLDSLSEPQKTFVISLAAEGGELLKSEAVAELNDGFEHTFQALMDDLAQIGLVFQDSTTLDAEHPLIGIPDSILKSIPISLSDRARLRGIMKAVSIGLLRTFTKDCNIQLNDTRRPFVIQAIRDHLLTPDNLKAFLNSLSEDKRTLLDLFLKEEEITPADLQEHLGESAVRELEDLVWKTPLFYALEGQKNGSLRLASDLSNAMRQIASTQGGKLETHPEDILADETIVPSVIQDNTPYFLQDLTTLLGQIERRHPRRLKSGGIPKGDLRDAARLSREETDPGYIDFIALFAETAGLVRIQGQTWCAAKDAGLRLEQVPVLRKAFFAFWQQTERWNEWSADRSTPSGSKSRVDELKSIRKEICKGLKRCPNDCWVPYSQFYQLLTRLSDPFRHFAEDPGSGRSLAAGGTTADELLRRILKGALCWMGLIRLGNPEAFAQPLHRSNKAVFQITPAGRALLQGTSDDLTEGIQPVNPKSKFVMQPNFEILSPPDLPPGHFLQLCGLADLESLDVMAHFRITRESLQHALNRDISADDLHTFLKTESATGLPDMVGALIEECVEKHGEIEIQSSSGYLTVAQESLLDELYAQKRIAAFLGPRLSPIAAALKRESRPEALLQVLHQQGYMPRLDAEFAASEQGQHQVILSSSELSELVGFLESAITALTERGASPSETLDYVISRFRRGLRRVPDQGRQEALARYGKDFESLGKPAQSDESGLQDLLQYTGANPSSQATEIRPLVEYAIDHRLCVEIIYHVKGETSERTIEPFSEDHAMLYAFCQTRKGDRVFRMDKIQSARLTGQKFQRA
ncbi:MAG: helicase-associated domain-containing protein [bacterium]|nr:helicase-associated domain-containing protein [bacterium]